MRRTRAARWAIAILAIAAIAAVAVWCRVATISTRPMHPDEAVQAMRTLHLLETGEFAYDPSDLHGPFFYYIAAGVALLSGRSTPSTLDETTLRCIPLLSGLLLVFLPLMAPGPGLSGRLMACALVATCSAMSFYSTMFFHEMLHVLLCWSFVLLLLRWLRRDGPASRSHIFLAGLALGLAIATKETWILVAGSALLAISISSLADTGWIARIRARLDKWALLAFLAPALIVPLLLFTNFLTAPEQIIKPLTAPYHYLDKMDGVSPSGNHRHSPLFLLGRLTWFHASAGLQWFLGVPLLLGIVGFFTSIKPVDTRPIGSSFMVQISIVTISLLLFHLILPYKTPWLLLLPLFGLCLMGGHALETMMRLTRSYLHLRSAMIIAGVSALVLLAIQAHRTTGRFANDPRNPWVYSAAADDVLSLSHRVHEAYECTDDVRWVDVWAVDYWPLPWYLRDVPNTAYWREIPVSAPAPIVIMNIEQEPGLAALLLERGYERQYFGLRNEVPVALYIDPVVMSCLRERWAGNTVAP